MLTDNHEHIFQGLREGWKIPESAWEKIGWRNAVRLLHLSVQEKRP